MDWPYITTSGPQLQGPPTLSKKFIKVSLGFDTATELEVSPSICLRLRFYDRGA